MNCCNLFYYLFTVFIVNEGDGVDDDDNFIIIICAFKVHKLSRISTFYLENGKSNADKS